MVCWYWKIPLKWMIWGYPHFRKLPYGISFVELLLSMLVYTSNQKPVSWTWRPTLQQLQHIWENNRKQSFGILIPNMFFFQKRCQTKIHNHDLGIILNLRLLPFSAIPGTAWRKTNAAPGTQRYFGANTIAVLYFFPLNKATKDAENRWKPGFTHQM